MLQSVHNKIFNRIVKTRRGKLFFSTEFSEFGDDEAARKALSRLQKNGVLERLAQGIYLYPKKDPAFGVLYPSTEEIAGHIARRDRARIIPSGAAALYVVGLSTQVPMNVVYLTDGAPRKLKVGKQTITFKATTARKLAFKGHWSMLVIQALQELGKARVDDRILQHLKSILNKENAKVVQHDLQLAPTWIARLLK